MTFVSQQCLLKHSHSFVLSLVLAWSVIVSFHLHFLRNFHSRHETSKSYSYADWIQSMASTQTKGCGSCISISFIVYNFLQIVAKSEYSLIPQTWKFTSNWAWFVSVVLAWSYNKSRLFDYLAISVVQNERKVFWFWFGKAQFGEHYFSEWPLFLSPTFLLFCRVSVWLLKCI